MLTYIEIQNRKQKKPHLLISYPMKGYYATIDVIDIIG